MVWSYLNSSLSRSQLGLHWLTSHWHRSLFPLREWLWCRSQAVSVTWWNAAVVRMIYWLRLGEINTLSKAFFKCSHCLHSRGTWSLCIMCWPVLQPIKPTGTNLHMWDCLLSHTWSSSTNNAYAHYTFYLLCLILLVLFCYILFKICFLLFCFPFFSYCWLTWLSFIWHFHPLYSCPLSAPYVFGFLLIHLAGSCYFSGSQQSLVARRSLYSRHLDSRAVGLLDRHPSGKSWSC